MKHLNNTLSGLLAGCCIIAGWWAYGWQGLVFALSVVVFGILLQFSRTNRLMREVAQRPLGRIDSVVMLQARLAHGLLMSEVITLTGSLGRKFSAHDEWQWTDAGDNQIVLTFRRGRLVRWSVARAEAETSPSPSDQPSATALPSDEATRRAALPATAQIQSA